MDFNKLYSQIRFLDDVPNIFLFTNFFFFFAYNQVENVVEENYGLTKISFLAHSLGGLFTRYAIAVMYSSDDLTMGVNITSQNTKTDDSKEVTSRSGLIAGLEPINFITLATPHLGVRGNKQVWIHVYHVPVL